jgi:SsrA-binding protein
MNKSINIINRRVKYEYEFIKTEIAGIVLMGSEVKSIRDGKISLSESFCVFIDGELYLKNANITEVSSAYTHKSNQDRKLLLKKVELKRFKKELVKGMTIVPYRVFINDKGVIKVEIVLGRGKNTYDKKETIKQRDINKETQKNMRQY